MKMKKYILVLLATLVLSGPVFGFHAAPPGFASQEAYNSTATYLESWDENAKEPDKGAFVWVKDGKRYRRKLGSTTDKKPSEISTNLWIEVTSPDVRFFKFDSQAAPLEFNANETPAEFLVRLDGAPAGAVKNLNPKGLALRQIMQNVLYQSWEYMTHKLNTGADDGNRKMLLRKIWEYRQWHHDFLLYKTQQFLGVNTTVNLYDSARRKLSDWSAAGSATLTSDIDVNLKGTNTEEAAEKFNELFIHDGWIYEPGVVYDVNVYALDFLHAEATFGSGMVVVTTNGNEQTTSDLHGNVLKIKNTVTDQTVTNNLAKATGLAGKEGARSGQLRGGFRSNSSTVALKDVVYQQLWPYLKTRLYMTETEYNLFCTTIGIDTESFPYNANSVKDEVDGAYIVYRAEINTKMSELANNDVPVVVDPTLTAIQEINAFAGALLGHQPGNETEQEEAEAANLLMAASNRVYEEKLSSIAQNRLELKTLITEFNGMAAGAEQDNKNDNIETKLQLLRDLVSESTLYANEAYVTDGSVNHAVVGVQSSVGIKLTYDETLSAVVENMADCLKEIGRHGGANLAATNNLGEAAFKAGKYMYRLADAAINMGYQHADIIKLFQAGDDLSKRIKNSKILTAREQEAQSATQIRFYFPTVDTPAKLKTKITDISTAVIAYAKAQPDGSVLSAPVGHAKTVVFESQVPLAASSVGNPYGFQGRRLDPESGLLYFRNRYYDPALGRFLTIDPKGNWRHEQGNGYSAFDEDPVNNRGMFGHDVVKCEDGATRDVTFFGESEARSAVKSRHDKALFWSGIFLVSQDAQEDRWKRWRHLKALGRPAEHVNPVWAPGKLVFGGDPDSKWTANFLKLDTLESRLGADRPGGRKPFRSIMAIYNGDPATPGNQAWGLISETFAVQVSGDVRAKIGTLNPARPAIWTTREYPRLYNFVDSWDKLIHLDPETFNETLAYKRNRNTGRPEIVDLKAVEKLGPLEDPK